MDSNKTKKHTKKHVEQKCNVCQNIQNTSLDVLHHEASENLHDEEPIEDKIYSESNEKQERKRNKLKQLYLQRVYAG